MIYFDYYCLLIQFKMRHKTMERVNNLWKPSNFFWSGMYKFTSQIMVIKLIAHLACYHHCQSMLVS